MCSTFSCQRVRVLTSPLFAARISFLFLHCGDGIAARPPSRSGNHVLSCGWPAVSWKRAPIFAVASKQFMVCFPRPNCRPALPHGHER